MKKFKGNITALITPFKNHEIDYQALERLIKFQIKKEVHGLVIAGTTGESPSLNQTEYQNLLEKAYEFNNQEVSLIAGIITNNFNQTIELSNIAEKAKYDAILLSVPFYVKPSQDGIKAYYKKVKEKCNLPIILYDNPGRSGVKADNNTIIELANEEVIIGIKDASSDITRLLVLKNTIINEDFSFLSGNDDLSLAFNIYGGDGCISAVANLVPGLCAKMQEYCFAGNYEKAFILQAQLINLIKYCFQEPSPAPIKAALSLMGICENELRTPMGIASDNLTIYIREELKKLEIL